LPLHDIRSGLLRIVTKGDDHTSRQITVALCLHDGPATIRALAERMNTAKPAVTRAVDRLETDGYAERRADPDDRRSVIVKLTSKGLKFVQVMNDG
jgi:DNA-binding MarR family transcriptional regulator